MRLFQHWPRARAALTRGLAVVLGLSGWAADAATGFDRVGRLADLQGEVSFFDPARGEWTEALRNRPVIAGDRIVLGRGARAEVRVAGAVLLLAQGADLEWLDLDAQQLRLRLHDGTLVLRLPSRALAEQTEVLTAETRLRPLRAGDYRVDRDGASTYAATLRGELEASGGGNLLLVGAGERYEVWIDSRREVARTRPAPLRQDRTAAWAESVWRADERVVVPSHLPDGLPGAEDLARHGRWDTHPEYGPLWFPVGVRSGWEPFRDGRWVWMQPWGWTWVDAAPWGFATSHYGRWVHWHGRWGWWPGPRHVRPVFAPAVVAWVGGANVSFSVRIGDVPPPAWAPLSPWEPYVPIVVYRPYPPHVHVPAPRHPPPRRLPPPSDPIAGRPSVTYGTQGVPVGVQSAPAARPTAPAPTPSVSYGTQGVPVGVQTSPSPSPRAPAPAAVPQAPSITYGTQGVPVGVQGVPAAGLAPAAPTRATTPGGPTPVAPSVPAQVRPPTPMPAMAPAVRAPDPAPVTAPPRAAPAPAPEGRKAAPPAPRRHDQVH